MTTAALSQYARGMARSDIEKAKEIYIRVSGNDGYRMNVSCGSCVLKLLQQLYPYYEDYKKKIEKQQEKDSNDNRGNKGQTNVNP